MQNTGTQTVALADYQKVVADYQKVELENLDLKQRLAWFERMMFGRKSERFVPSEEALGQLKMEFEGAAAQEIEQTVRQIIAAHERKVPEPAKQSTHKGRLPIPADLPRVK